MTTKQTYTEKMQAAADEIVRGAPSWADAPMALYNSEEADSFQLVHVCADMQLLFIAARRWSNNRLFREMDADFLPEWVRTAFASITGGTPDERRRRRARVGGQANLLNSLLHARLQMREDASQPAPDSGVPPEIDIPELIYLPEDPILEWSYGTRMPTDSAESIFGNGNDGGGGFLLNMSFPEDAVKDFYGQATQNWYFLYHYMVNVELVIRAMRSEDLDAINLWKSLLPVYAQRPLNLYVATRTAWERAEVIGEIEGILRHICGVEEYEDD